MIHLRALLTGALLSSLLAGCGGPSQGHRSPPNPPGRPCTLIGCASGAQVDLTGFPLRPGPKSLVTVCVDNTCSSRSPEALPLASAEVDAPYNSRSDVVVTISVTGPGGELLAHDSIRSRLDRFQPNGPECLPVCFITRLVLTSSGRLERA